ncbi:hypothetical protein ABI125_07745 [Tamlana crocina]
MYERIKNVFRIIHNSKQWQKENYNQLKELEWAHIYHDSIRGKKWLEEMPLNVGRWAGNYAFFYILNRVLTQHKPKSIIEFGLGESSKFISVFIENYLKNSKHLIIEHSQEWANAFKADFNLSVNSKIRVHNLVKRQVKGVEINAYSNLEEIAGQKFDLYIIDGPFVSKNFSRYDILDLAKKLTSNDDFIIIFDDYQRHGEQQTVKDLLELFRQNNIIVYEAIYSGNKSLAVLATAKYKYATSY